MAHSDFQEPAEGLKMTHPTYRPEWTDTMPTARIPQCPPCTGDCQQGHECDADPVIATTAGTMLGAVALAVVACLLVAIVLIASFLPEVAR